MDLLSRLPKLRLGMFHVAETINEPPLINPIVSNLEVLGLSVLAPAPGAHSAKVATGFAIRVRASSYSGAFSGG